MDILSARSRGLGGSGLHRRLQIRVRSAAEGLGAAHFLMVSSRTSFRSPHESLMFPPAIGALAAAVDAVVDGAAL